MGKDRTCEVVCPPERHIPLPPHELSHVFLSRLADSDKEKYRELLKLFQGTSQFEFVDIRQRVKRNFRLFSLGASGEEYKSRGGFPKKQALEEREQTFISDFILLMRAAHYQLLTQREWDTALAEEFQLNMPVTVNWDYLDKDMLTRYWEGRPEERGGLAEMSDSILVFHRGVGVIKVEGLFISEKIDLLVAHLVGAITGPLSRLWKWATGKKEPAGYEGVAEGEEEEEEWKVHKNRRIVQRRTLNRVLYDIPTVLKNVFKKVEIQEPTFEEMLVMYRKKGHKPKDLRATPQAAKLAKRNIFVKTFKDVPMADAELIFPEKKVFIKQIMKIQLLVTVIAAFAAAGGMLVGTDLDYAVIGSALMLILGRATQVYTSLAQRKAELTSELSKMVYSKAKDSQEGALNQVLDEMADQTLKETILTYSLLLTHHGPLTKKGLDEECERFLEENFNMKIDFALDESLHRLQKEGLVSTESDVGVLCVKDLDRATGLMKEKWHGYFDEMNDMDESSSFLHGSKLQKSSTFLTQATTLGGSTVGAVKQGFRSGIQGVKSVFTGTKKADDSEGGHPGLLNRIKTRVTSKK
ncbi:unnamed protein product [Ostreobium quekettii]|uniref:Uncharacterized protein n=1 Tax=Ostreobium quekettii TaxID=121088 RepID=A0A8S1J2B8_9CHLO|nr:unnamed protein product [Ostreobium quekettii]